MRRRSVVVTATLSAALALAALPGPAGSAAPAAPRIADRAAFRQLVLTTMDQWEPTALTDLDADDRAAGFTDASGQFLEPVVDPPVAPVVRPTLDQPGSPVGTTIKPPRYTISGYATFYDHGTTAMRLPRGTIVRICGEGGCIERVVNDYGPVAANNRVVDLYRPDFFEICGCAWFAGTAWVTVSVY